MKSLKTLIREGILDTSIGDLNANATIPFLDEYMIRDFQFYYIDEEGYLSEPYYEYYFDVKKLVRDVKKDYGLKSSKDKIIESSTTKEDWDIVKALVILLEHCTALSYQDDYIEKLREYLFRGCGANIVANQSFRSGEECKWKIEITNTKGYPLILYFYTKKNI